MKAAGPNGRSTNVQPPGGIASTSGPSQLVLMEKPRGIGATTGTVAHLRQERLRSITKSIHEPRGRRRSIAKFRSGSGDQGDQVVKVHLQARNGLGDCHGVGFVHAGNDHRVDLDDAAHGLEGSNRLHLPMDQVSSRLASPQARLSLGDPLGDALSDSRIHRVDRDGNVADIKIHKRLDMLCRDQAVCGEAEMDPGVRSADELKGGERPFGIRERIARTRNADNRDVGHPSERRVQVGESLLGLQHAAGHSGPAFIRAVIHSIAVAALNVAGRRYR